MIPQKINPSSKHSNPKKDPESCFSFITLSIRTIFDKRREKKEESAIAGTVFISS
jgi:hypothetical protein